MRSVLPQNGDHFEKVLNWLKIASFVFLVSYLTLGSVKHFINYDHLRLSVLFRTPYTSVRCWRVENGEFGVNFRLWEKWTQATRLKWEKLRFPTTQSGGCKFEVPFAMYQGQVMRLWSGAYCNTWTVPITSAVNPWKQLLVTYNRQKDLLIRMAY